jgi:hypothetical protein
MYLDSSGYVQWVWGPILRMEFNKKMYSPKKYSEYISLVCPIFHIRP